jgi:hypothetical protein
MREIIALGQKWLAQLLGQGVGETISQNSAGRDALSHDQNLDRRIGKDCVAHLKEPFRSPDHGDLLYDEKGMPR